MKVIAMIPVRMGSQRVKNKNLRLINGKPLVKYILESTIAADVFDEIYINSEADVFDTIANESSVKFYKRSEYLASNEATNDDFALDFINNVECNVIIQLLATSPFISPDEIRKFVNDMIENNYDTLISVKNEQIECVYDEKPINFVQKEKTPPSQSLIPIQAYACGLMGWRSETFKSNIEKYDSAYHGGDGNIGFFTLHGYSTVDIDTEDDFAIAEAVAKAIEAPNQLPDYYQPEKVEKIADADRERILVDDGVSRNTMFDFNNETVVVKDIIEKNGRNESWSHTVINSLSNSATLIAQLPGEGNRMHWHPSWDEWWYIIEGEWEWMIEGDAKTITAGQIVFIDRGKKHCITAKGDKMAIRLAVSRNDVDHVYDPENY
jgi:CMP-N-acetylneuraminic acid synthetase/quercetin dioxygenase-like cupin family protein